MKKLSFLIIGMLLSAAVSAQDADGKARKNEIYIKPKGLFNFSDIALEYKRQLGKKTYWKLGVQDMNLSINRSAESSSNSRFNNIRGEITSGIEFRNPLINKVSIIHGPNLGFIYGNTVRIQEIGIDPVTKVQDETISSIGGSFLYTIGALYSIKDRLIFGVELLPEVSWTQSTIENNIQPTQPETHYNMEFNMISNSRFMIGCRF